MEETRYSQKIVRTNNKITENHDIPIEAKLKGSPSIFRIVKPLGTGIPTKNIIKNRAPAKSKRTIVRRIFFRLGFKNSFQFIN
jgi:hypothetical protein